MIVVIAVASQLPVRGVHVRLHQTGVDREAVGQHGIVGQLDGRRQLDAYPCGGCAGVLHLGDLGDLYAGHDAGQVFKGLGLFGVGVFVQFDIDAACGDHVMGDGVSIVIRQRPHSGNGDADHHHRQQ